MQKYDDDCCSCDVRRIAGPVSRDRITRIPDMSPVRSPLADSNAIRRGVAARCNRRSVASALRRGQFSLNAVSGISNDLAAMSHVFFLDLNWMHLLDCCLF